VYVRCIVQLVERAQGEQDEIKQGRIEWAKSLAGRWDGRSQTGETKMDVFTGLTETELDTLVTALTILIEDDTMGLEIEKAVAVDLRARVVEQIELGL
jgi:hypothetical protein